MRDLEEQDISTCPVICELSVPVTSKVLPDFAPTHSPLTYATLSFSKDWSLSFGTLCCILEACLIYTEGKLKLWNRDRETVREKGAVDLKMFMTKGVERCRFIVF